MKIQQLIEEQMKEFDEKFVTFQPDGTNWGAGLYLNEKVMPDDIKSFISSSTRKLIEALGSELINNFMEDLNYYNPGKPPCTDDSPCGCHFGEMFHADGMCLCDIEKKQRLKLKEIISSI